MENAPALAAAADSSAPRTGLRAVAALRRLLEQLEALQVDNAREHGWAWQEIAEILGVSRQAGHQKAARPPRPRALTRGDTEDVREIPRPGQDGRDPGQDRGQRARRPDPPGVHAAR